MKTIRFLLNYNDNVIVAGIFEGENLYTNFPYRKFTLLS